MTSDSTEQPDTGFRFIQDRRETVRTALTAATQQLTAITDTPRLDAELLMAHALGATRNDLLLRHLDDAAPDTFAALLQRRLAHEPVAYLTGTRAFWTIDLEVGPGALVPRPDSETLLEAALEHFARRTPRTILDLGTGPGTLLLAALDQWPEAEGLGVDASDQALAYARRNADRLGLATRATFRLGDWTAGLDGQFDLILANPPYIGTGEALPPEVRDHEPASALFAGADGLDDYRRIVPELSRLLAPGGAALLEIGWTQGEAVSALGTAHGLVPRIFTDLAGRPRVVGLS
ncbi:peptide chain release factor N(5)-glutamine methyltransferase [Sphingomonas xinjiangensis]|uniref:Release factor glutamine methyltransferase n=1 Tax=Sphingomonas xinjiangensis TaxID=643568 RepID=A0A840YJC4_9SPHN|nr:peptide chain release factor N(5)-glutamine methyltransferase [Sphingomonas xinjiangensis]MBB5712259.1 release factor glutamine methyltransferase [Sphingomonas xinjiangensis]